MPTLIAIPPYCRPSRNCPRKPPDTVYLDSFSFKLCLMRLSCYMKCPSSRLVSLLAQPALGRVAIHALALSIENANARERVIIIPGSCRILFTRTPSYPCFACRPWWGCHTGWSAQAPGWSYCCCRLGERANPLLILPRLTVSSRAIILQEKQVSRSLFSRHKIVHLSIILLSLDYEMLFDWQFIPNQKNLYCLKG